MNTESSFQKAMVEYLESVHQGEFMQGSMESVETMIHEKNQANPFRVPPTETLPSIPPTKCEHKQQADCIQCAQIKE